MKPLLRLALISLVTAIGCAGNPMPSPQPTQPERLFVADLLNGLLIFNEPINSASTPAFVIPGQGDAGVAFDPNGNLYVSNEATETIAVYHSPVVATSVPFLVIGPISGAITPEGMAFDAAGSLYVADEAGDEILVFTRPFITGSQTPSEVITGMPAGPVNVVFDRAGDLITPSFGFSTVSIFRPPFAKGANKPAATMLMPLPAAGCGIDRMDRIMVGQQDGSIAIVTPPFASGVTPSTIVAAPLIDGSQATEALNSAFDMANDLWQPYAGDDSYPGQAGIAEFPPPYITSSVTLGTSNGLAFPFSVAFGQ